MQMRNSETKVSHVSALDFILILPRPDPEGTSLAEAATPITRGKRIVGNELLDLPCILFPSSSFLPSFGVPYPSFPFYILSLLPSLLRLPRLPFPFLSYPYFYPLPTSSSSSFLLIVFLFSPRPPPRRLLHPHSHGRL